MTRTAPSTAWATSATLGGESDPLPAESEPGLYLQLPDVDVLLKLARKKLAHLRIQPGDIRRKRENAEKDGNGDCGNEAHDFPPRFGRRLRSTKPAGKANCFRRRLSRRRICPWSRSWSKPARCSSPCRISTLTSICKVCP